MHSTLRPSVFLGEQAGRSGSPPVKWFILRVLGDVPSATTAELTQTMSIRGRAAARSARGGRNGDRRDRPARPADHSPLSACTPPVGPRPRPRYRIGRGEIVNATETRCHSGHAAAIGCPQCPEDSPTQRRETTPSRQLVSRTCSAGRLAGRQSKSCSRLLPGRSKSAAPLHHCYSVWKRSARFRHI